MGGIHAAPRRCCYAIIPNFRQRTLRPDEDPSAFRREGRLPDYPHALLLITMPPALAQDRPGPYDDLRWLTIEDAEALLAPVCPGHRFPTSSDNTMRLSGKVRVIDGDSISIDHIKLRLGPPDCKRSHGIDARAPTEMRRQAVWP